MRRIISGCKFVLILNTSVKLPPDGDIRRQPQSLENSSIRVKKEQKKTAGN